MKYLLALVGIYCASAMMSALLVHYFGEGIHCDAVHIIAWVGLVSAIINIIKFIQEINQPMRVK